MYDGNTSMVSPRTRNTPRLKSRLLRSYWMDTRRERISKTVSTSIRAVRAGWRHPRRPVA